MTPEKVYETISQKNIEMVDLRFMDFPGTRWQHVTIEASHFMQGALESGFGFDGSCVKGWEKINEGDMLLMPVASTAYVDPTCELPTLAIICDIKEPTKRKRFSRDPRSVARKAEKYMIDSGIADEARFSPEIEFFIFDKVRFHQGVNAAWYEVDSHEGVWNRGKDSPENMGTQFRLAKGLFPEPPIDSLVPLRNQMVKAMKDIGMPVMSHFHESAGAQCEIGMLDGSLLKMAEYCLSYKYIVRNIAAQNGRTATFMPKPVFEENGSGMHTHFSLFKDGEPLFDGHHYAGLSRTGLHAIGGILKHARALMAFTNPTTNSFKRLTPGYEAPVSLTYSSRNRWTAIRVPQYSKNPESRRLEIRFPDPSCNPYLAFSALLMAALDGIENQIDPGNPIDVDVSELASGEYENFSTAPNNLHEALDALEADHEFLLKGNVFTKDVIKYWVQYKMETEVAAIGRRPHPYEFCMYYNI